MNLLDGTKDFSGDWVNSGAWTNDGIYKGLTVKKRTELWSGIYKTFSAPKDGVYTFSAYVKSSGNNAKIYRFVELNGENYSGSEASKYLENDFDWIRDSFTVTLKTGDTFSVKYEISGEGTDSILWTAGHKWEEGSTATPWMPTYSEATVSDYPSYIGTYTGKISDGQSTDQAKYNWKKYN